LEAAKEAAHKDGQEGWKFTVQAPSYGPVHAVRGESRAAERIYRAHVTRASEFGKSDFDNTSLITRELQLRKEKARLLVTKLSRNFRSSRKMAESPEAALDFLHDLAARALPHARWDYAELEEFARAELGIQELQAWDIAFASEKLRAKRYAFFRSGSEAVFPGTQGPGRHVPACRSPLWHSHLSGRGQKRASGGAFFRITESDGSLIGPVLSGSVLARDQARRGVDG